MSDSFAVLMIMLGLLVLAGLYVLGDSGYRNIMEKRRRAREKRANEKAAADRRAEIEAAWPEQKRRGDLLLARVTNAARQNPNTGNSTTRRLSVGRIQHNGGAYSVLVTLIDGSWRGVVCQFDIRRDKLCWLYGPHGPNDEASTSEFDSMVEKACERVRTFK